MIKTRKTRVYAYIASVMIASVVVAVGADLNWEATGTNDWETAVNWDPDAVPSSASNHNCKIFNGGTARITQSGQSAQYLTLAYSYGETGNLRLESGSLETTSDQTLGRAGHGTFSQFADTTNTVGFDMAIGEHSGGLGIYTMHGGSLNVNNGNIRVGYYDGSTGHVVQTGGRIGPMTGGKYLFLGHNAGSIGSYTMCSNAVIALTNSENYIYVGEYGTGTFIQSNGTVEVNNYFMVGRRGGSTGYYRIEDGTLDIGGWLVVGEEATATGTVEIVGTNSSITVGGEYSQNSLSTLNVELNAGGVSPITVTGAATVDGILTVGFNGTDYGDLADTVTIINAAGLSGKFDTTNFVSPVLGVDVVYDSINGDVKLTNFEFPPGGTVMILL